MYVACLRCVLINLYQAVCSVALYTCVVKRGLSGTTETDGPLGTVLNRWGFKFFSFW